MRSLTNLLLLLLLLLLFTGCTRTEKSYDAQGNLQSEIPYRGDKIHGKAVWYYHTGEPQQEFIYQKGLLDGPARRWYFNGRLESETHYKGGEKHGSDKAWDESGTLLLWQHWMNDTLHGMYEEYFPNGKPRVRGKYTMGDFDSTWTYLDARGLIVGRGIFAQGQGELQAYFTDGKPHRLVPYRDNEKHGWEIWLDRKGDTLRKRFFEDGILIQELILKEGEEGGQYENEDAFEIDPNSL